MAQPVDPVPEQTAERLARFLARPIDRRTFLALSAVAGPAALAACNDAVQGSIAPTATSTPSASIDTSAPPSTAPSTPPHQVADWVFVGGPILTMEATGTATGLAVRGDRIVAVGQAAAMLDFVGDGTRLVELAGRTVLPGFVDAHQHIAGPVAAGGGDLSAVEDEAISLGITSRGEAAVRQAELGPILEWASRAEPRIRTSLYLLHNDNCGQDQGPWYRAYPATRDRSAKLRIAGVKLFTDGGSCGAPAVSFDYPSGVGRGDLYLTRDAMAPLLEELTADGYQALIHSLGDRALDEVLASLATALAGGANPTRHRIDHNALVRPDQLERYAELDVIAVVFGAFAACLYAGDRSQFKYRVPADKQSLEWRWRELLDAATSGHVGWHSDAPIFSLDPLAHLSGFVTRTEPRPDGTVCQPPDWARPNLLEAADALRVMTLGSAYALDREADVGSLAVGKLADLVILDGNPLDLAPDQIRNLSVQLTMIGGVAEHVRPGAEDLAPSPVTTAPPEISPLPPVPTGANLAAGRPVIASRSLAESPPSNVVDGAVDTDAVWNAGEGPPQWIEVDLGADATVVALRLVVAQFPAGVTRHRVTGRASESGPPFLIHEFAGQTADQDLLVAVLDPPIEGLRWVRIETLATPSFVAWREIEVIGPGP